MTNLRIETTEEFKKIKDFVNPTYEELSLPTSIEVVQNKYLDFFIDNKLIKLDNLSYLEINLNPGNTPIRTNLSYTGELEYTQDYKSIPWIPIKETWLPFNKEKFGSTVPESHNLDFKLEAVSQENPEDISRGIDIQVTLGNKSISLNKAKVVIEKGKVPYLELRIPFSDLSINLNTDLSIINEE